MMEPGPTDQEAGASAQDHVSSPSRIPKSEEQSFEIPSTSAAQAKSASHLSGFDQKHEEGNFAKPQI